MFELTLNAEESLVEGALSAIVNSGCVINSTQTSKSSFLLQVRKGDELLSARIYLWELTPRSKNQYEIQIADIDRFELLPSGKTLILGWWKEAEVFVGFDVRKHLGRLGSSSSMQIREDTLRKAYINGFEPCDKGNKEVAIAFRPDFFVEYLQSLEPLHDFGQSEKDLAVLSDVAQNPEINEADIQIQNIARKTTAVFVRRKLRDLYFHKCVLTAYYSRCSFCNTFENVEAVHIIPLGHDMSTDETRNGLALCALHHKAYDQALVTVIDDYTIQVNRNQATELQNQKLSDGLAKFSQDLRPIIILPPAISDRPHAEYIRIANSIRGWK